MLVIDFLLLFDVLVQTGLLEGVHVLFLAGAHLLPVDLAAAVLLDLLGQDHLEHLLHQVVHDYRDGCRRHHHLQRPATMRLFGEALPTAASPATDPIPQETRRAGISVQCAPVRCEVMACPFFMKRDVQAPKGLSSLTLGTGQTTCGPNAYRQLRHWS